MSDGSEKIGWLKRLGQGLSRSSARLTDSLTAILTHRKLDDEIIEQIEDVLIASDIGVAPASRLVADLRRQKFGQDISDEEIRTILATSIAAMLAPVAQPLILNAAARPTVILIAGVNGSGKTTTIGKLAAEFRAAGKSVMIAAGDTFRAAAIEQLAIWADRSGAVFFAGKQGGDAASLAYEALAKAQKEAFDVLLIDTAGRLHNRADLMAELSKIVRVMQKLDPAAPHHRVIVLDATIGQNAIPQIETFQKLIDLTGLIVTKLDGSAKGGIIIALAEKFALPIHLIGVGEGIDDLRPFRPIDFAQSLMGLPR